MHFEITRALKPGRQLTSAQRTSSMFAEAPRIGSVVLRRGRPPLKLNEKQFAINLPRIKHLFAAGAIEISAVNGSSREDLRSVIEEAKKSESFKGMTLPAILSRVLNPALSFARDELEQLSEPQEPSTELTPEEEPDALEEEQKAAEEVPPNSTPEEPVTPKAPELDPPPMGDTVPMPPPAEETPTEPLEQPTIPMDAAPTETVEAQPEGVPEEVSPEAQADTVETEPATPKAKKGRKNK